MHKTQEAHKEIPRVFYDGSCGLCHRFVRFTLVRMKTPFIFSPIQGETFSALIKAKKIEIVPDSIAVYDKKQDQIYFKTEAVLYVLHSLGKGWKCIADVMSCIPLCITNAVYDFIARRRRTFFQKPDTVCPVLPDHLRKFFTE